LPQIGSAITTPTALQVNLAVGATDYEVVVQERERVLQKRDADPLKAIASMATLLGGKIVLVQAVRLILSVCLLVSSGAAFYSLITYTSLNVPVSLAIVVAANVALAAILLLIVVLQRPKSGGGFGGLTDLLGGSKSKQTAEQLVSMLPPAFEPYVFEAVNTIRNLQAEGEGQQPARNGNGLLSRRVHRSVSTVREGLPLVTSTSGVPNQGSAAHAVNVARAATGLQSAQSQPKLLGKVAETGQVLLNRLPPKHRNSQAAHLAASVLTELKELSQQQQNRQSQQQPVRSHASPLQQPWQQREGSGSRDGTGSGSGGRGGSMAGPNAQSRSAPSESHRPQNRMYVHGGDMHSGELPEEFRVRR
jgi:hypothetical protein